MKTKEQITKEIEALKTIRPNVRPTTFFGDNNLAALDAQIQVLEEYMDEDEIWDEWPEEERDEYVRSSALHAFDWTNDDEDPDDGSLAEDWPLKEKPE
ncbi:hypothetical protein LCGC14_0875490 [marine sediment metagenome]|uniref:Uncharacterized protein n=1 Tax=marine sediment metagenome TaxID=412755 RepID=A0A0F9P8G0_9ZZZZ